MLSILLLDLGDTLVVDDAVLPGVPEALAAIGAIKTAAGEPLVACLASDFTMPSPRTPAAVDAAFAEYLSILDRFDLRRFFEPVDERVTLSTHAGVFKPARWFFETALERAKADVGPGACLFITENADHVAACRAMGMTALQFGVDFRQWSEGSAFVERLVNPAATTTDGATPGLHSDPPGSPETASG